MTVFTTECTNKLTGTVTRHKLCLFRGVHSIVRRLRTNPPRKINLRFFLFLRSPYEACFLTNESKANEFDRRSFATLELTILKLQENCNGGLRVGRGPGRVIDIAIAIAKGCERDAQGIAVRVVEAMWCSVAIT